MFEDDLIDEYQQLCELEWPDNDDFPDDQSMDSIDGDAGVLIG